MCAGADVARDGADVCKEMEKETISSTGSGDYSNTKPGYRTRYGSKLGPLEPPIS